MEDDPYALCLNLRDNNERRNVADMGSVGFGGDGGDYRDRDADPFELYANHDPATGRALEERRPPRETVRRLDPHAVDFGMTERSTEINNQLKRVRDVDTLRVKRMQKRAMRNRDMEQLIEPLDSDDDELIDVREDELEEDDEDDEGGYSVHQAQIDQEADTAIRKELRLVDRMIKKGKCPVCVLTVYAKKNPTDILAPTIIRAAKITYDDTDEAGVMERIKAATNILNNDVIQPLRRNNFFIDYLSMAHLCKHNGMPPYEGLGCVVKGPTALETSVRILERLKVFLDKHVYTVTENTREEDIDPTNTRLLLSTVALQSRLVREQNVLKMQNIKLDEIRNKNTDAATVMMSRNVKRKGLVSVENVHGDAVDAAAERDVVPYSSVYHASFS